MKVASYLKHHSFAVRLDLGDPPLLVTLKDENPKSQQLFDLRHCAAEEHESFVTGRFDYQPPDWVSGSIRLKHGFWSLDPCLRAEDISDIDECKTWSYIQFGENDDDGDDDSEDDYLRASED